MEGAKAVMEGRCPSTIHCAPSVHHIAQAQTAIGWEDIFRGRFAMAWRSYYTNWLGDRATKKINGSTWGAALAKLMLQQWYNLWIERNGDRHGRDYRSKRDAEKRQAIREVELLYEMKDLVQEQHNWIFSAPLTEMKQKKGYVLRAWVDSYGPILKESHQTRLETG